MRDRTRRSGREVREQIAQMAARLLFEDGALGFGAARRKAQERLGHGAWRDLPDNREIEAALIAYQRLFGGDAHRRRVDELRRQAIDAMHFLRVFDPHLVGSVLAGTAGEHAPVTLHLFAEPLEEVMFFLDERNIPYELGERRYGDGGRVYPRLGFLAGETRIELVVFPTTERHVAPPSQIDGRPMRRADLAEVTGLLESDAFDGP